MHVKGDNFLKSTISKLSPTSGPKTCWKPSARGRPRALRRLRDRGRKVLGNFIRNEHPQTVSLILAHLESGKGRRC